MKKRATNKKFSKAENGAECKQCFNPWSLSIYVYWFIILFFIASTFYILGRSHNMGNTSTNGVVAEEALLTASDYYILGSQKLLAGNREEAIVDLTAAIDAGADMQTYLLRGEAYMQSGNYDAALADFDAVIAMDKNASVAYYDRALVNSRLENYSVALNDINNALAALAEQPSPYLQMRDLYAKRGQLNLWLKNWEGAVADYTQSLSLPEGTVSPRVYAERAEAYTALGRYADAANDYSSAIRIISEQIQGAQSDAVRESLSNNAMSYFEKSAALNLQIGNMDSARSDLDSAYTLATALGDSDSMQRLQNLKNEMDVATQVPAETPAEVPAEVPAETPAETPAEFPPEVVTDVTPLMPEPAPVETPAEAPMDVTPPVPVEAPAEMPTEVPAEVPAEAPADVPAEVVAEIESGNFVIVEPGMENQPQ